MAVFEYSFHIGHSRHTNQTSRWKNKLNYATLFLLSNRCKNLKIPKCWDDQCDHTCVDYTDYHTLILKSY